jgi:hypothetical protein
MMTMMFGRVAAFSDSVSSADAGEAIINSSVAIRPVVVRVV